MEKINYLTTEQAAEYIGSTPHALSSWRRGNQNKGPAYIRLGGKVFYTAEDLDKWVQSCRVEQGK
jgi:hypothetical protein